MMLLILFHEKSPKFAYAVSFKDGVVSSGVPVSNFPATARESLTREGYVIMKSSAFNGYTAADIAQTWDKAKTFWIG